VAKRGGKKGKLATLPLDLSAMAGEPMESIQAHALAAYDSAVEAFDARCGERYVFAGRGAAPMGKRVEASKDGLTLRLLVSARPVSVRNLRVRPGLTVATTGSNRAAVFAASEKGRDVEVPRGFVWNGGIFQRRENDPRKIDSAKAFLVKAGADLSPAAVLGRLKDDVVKAATDALLGGLDGRKNDG
jgi:hypothetical protein